MCNSGVFFVEMKSIASDAMAGRVVGSGLSIGLGEGGDGGRDSKLSKTGRSAELG